MAERTSVLDAIRRLQLQHDSMEFFGARSDRPLETCLAEVKRSNILVVIIGHRYGTVIPTTGYSFPHAEYEEGYKRGKPCLVYFRDDDMPVLPKHVERDGTNIRRLDRWKASLRTRHTIATFRDAHDLAIQVTADLSRTLNAIESAKLATRRESAISLPTLIDRVKIAVNDAMARGVTHSDIAFALRSAIRSLAPSVDIQANVVLISYADQDRLLANATAHALEEAHMVVVDGLSQRLASASEASDAFRGVDCIVFLISQASVQSNDLQNAWNIAVAQRISIGADTEFVPVLIETADVPPVFRDAHVLDVRSSETSAVTSRIVAAVVDLLR